MVGSSGQASLVSRKEESSVVSWERRARRILCHLCRNSGGNDEQSFAVCRKDNTTENPSSYPGKQDHGESSVVSSETPVAAIKISSSTRMFKGMRFLLPFVLASASIGHSLFRARSRRSLSRSQYDLDWILAATQKVQFQAQPPHPQPEFVPVILLRSNPRLLPPSAEHGSNSWALNRLVRSLAPLDRCRHCSRPRP